MGESQSIRDRVVELRRVPARELREHPENWRIHPEAQANALGTVLTEIGFAGAVLAYQDGDALVLVDGHLRRDMAGDTVIPVLVTDLTPDEADALLAVYDPIADMAEVNRAKQKALLDKMAKQREAFAGLAETVGDVSNTTNPGVETWADAFNLLPENDRSPFQQMTFTLHDDQVETVREAIRLAGGMGPYGDTGNENGNGNALARICEVFITNNG